MEEFKFENKGNEHIKVKKSSIWKVLTYTLGVLLVLSLITGGFKIKDSITGLTTKGDLGDNVLNYIKQNLIQAGDAVELKDMTEESGVYNLKLVVNNQEFNSYATKDGKLLFISGIDMTQEIVNTPEPATTATAEDWSVFNSKLPKDVETKILGFGVDKGEVSDGKVVEYKKYEAIPNTMIVFYQSGCGWCTRFYPVLVEAKKKYPKMTIYALTLSDNQPIANKYSVTGTPTTIVNGKYVVGGYMAIKDLSDVLDKLK